MIIQIMLYALIDTPMKKKQWHGKDYLKSNDINLFFKDLLDDLDDEFMFLYKRIDELEEQIDELNKELEKAGIEE